MESSLDLGENVTMSIHSSKEKREISPNYEDLQNVLVLPTTEDKDNNELPCEGQCASEDTPEKQYEENNALPYIIEGTTIQDEIEDSGHRIIDVNHFKTELTKKESKFTYLCKMCGYKNTIKSSLGEVNKDAVAGIMAAGFGHAQLKQFSAAVGLPIMSDHTYIKTQHDICNDWEETAWDEMKKAGEREREAAIKEGRVTKDGIPFIDVCSV